MSKSSMFFLSMLILLAVSCKKDSKTTTPATTTSPYYFKFTFNGANYNFNYNFPQYISIYTNEFGGYQVANGNLSPDVGISFTWHNTDTVRESDVMGLKGKTIYFNDTSITPDLMYDTDFSSSTWISVDTSNTSYYVTISDISYLKNDSTLGNSVRTYVLSGTCNALMSRGDTTRVLSGGNFHFIVSRRNY